MNNWEPAAEEVRLGLDHTVKDGWTSYARILLSSNEFSYID